MVQKHELYPRKTSINMIDSFQRKILRKILGHTQAMGVWRIGHNEELYKLYVAAALSTFVRLKVQKWGGQVVRMSDSCGGFRRRRPVGKMGGSCLKGWLRFDPGTELEGSSKEHHTGGRRSRKP
jgi:hypothetical protein